MRFAVELKMNGKMNMLSPVSELPGLLALLGPPSGKLKRPIQIAPPTLQWLCICVATVFTNQGNLDTIVAKY